MRSHRVDTIKDFLSPQSQYWSRVQPTQVMMVPTPIAMQPTAYVRNTWADRKYGETTSIDVASVHDGATWAVLVQWSSAVAHGPTEFADALAVALPVSRNAVLALMGSPEAPIHYLWWNARQTSPQSLLATGIGASAPGPDVRQTAQASADGPTWRIVISRAVGTGPNAAPLEVGATTGVGFAAWRGSNDERAGIKAFSVDWTELVLDA